MKIFEKDPKISNFNFLSLITYCNKCKKQKAENHIIHLKIILDWPFSVHFSIFWIKLLIIHKYQKSTHKDLSKMVSCSIRLSLKGMTMRHIILSTFWIVSLPTVHRGVGNDLFPRSICNSDYLEERVTNVTLGYEAKSLKTGYSLSFPWKCVQSQPIKQTNKC